MRKRVLGLLTLLAFADGGLLASTNSVYSTYTNDLARLEASATNLQARLDICDSILTYTNTPAVHSWKGWTYYHTGNYSNALAEAEIVANTNLLACTYVRLKDYGAVLSLRDGDYPVWVKVMALRMNGATDEQINNAFEEHFKTCANYTKPPFTIRFFNGYYTRSIATTEEYVALLQDILRVVETNEDTLDFKSQIKSELEANL